MPRTIMPRTKQSKKKSKNYYCNLSKKEIGKQVPQPVLSRYKSIINSNINTFTNNHNQQITNLLNTANSINHIYRYKVQQLPAHKIKFNVEYKDLFIGNDPDPKELDELGLEKSIPEVDESRQFKIPPFIEVFKYLFSLPLFSKYFTSTELAEANEILNTQPRHLIYQKLHKSPLGNKMSDTYSQLSRQIDLTKQFPTTDFHSLLFNSFTSYTILEDIEANMRFLTICNLKYQDKEYPNFLYIFHDSHINYKAAWETDIWEDFYHIKKTAYAIIKRVIFLNTILKTDKLPHRLIIFLTNNKKEIDHDLEMAAHFRTKNVNTAVTNMQDIIIYREEELLKSIFHELIHFHNLDYKILADDIKNDILSYLYKTHNISTQNDYLLYESITETLTNVLNNIFISKDIKEFKTNLAAEILFATFQVIKILRICKYKSWEEFVLLDNYKPNTNKHFKQDSCVFSYYILKLYILLNLDEYWSTILDNNLKFNPSKENFEKLKGIFEKGRQNKYLGKVINIMLDSKTNYSKNKTSKIFKNKINRTLRMTCLDADN